MRRRNSLTCSLALLLTTITAAEDNPRHVVLDACLSQVRTLGQNWSHEESNWFYNVPQGSRLIPYTWFLHLEQPDSQKRFLDPTHIRQLGYLARGRSDDNPDALPIGFIKDAAYADGTAGLGVTCAACHTGQINYRRTAFLIDGGPSLGDIELFMERLAESLQKIADEDRKFARFARAVLAQDATDETTRELRARVRLVAKQRREYNQRNFSQNPTERFGHGRVDAFGAIFNEVSTTFLDLPDNSAPANAPVSYPCLWDAPAHDRVQWNGGAENRTSPLGTALFGTVDVGALGRNAGQVLGVFGHSDINDREGLIPRRYRSTVNKARLLEIDAALRKLWSPKWPDALGVIDPESRQRGETLYRDHCIDCHHLIDREAPDRRVAAKLADSGTDPMVLRNFWRSAKTGKLEGRRKTLLGTEHFDTEASVGSILKHVVERVILNPLSAAQLKGILSVKFDDHAEVDGLNPGFKNMAIILAENKQLSVPVDSIHRTGDSLKIAASESSLLKLARGLSSDAKNTRGLEHLEKAKDRLKRMIVKTRGAGNNSAPVARLSNASASLGYKARPLNGVWATAPYLHNGSVATLAEMLKPVEQRKSMFHVGSMQYDPINVGFVSDPSYPKLDTRIDGNRNIGHEHGTELEPEEKLDLIEYLKSL